MLWIIGGTTETGQLLEKIRGKTEYIVTVATSSGKEVLQEKNHVIVARMDYRMMCDFIREHSIDTVVDISHPYAVDVTHNVRKACQECEIRYFRYVRTRAKIDDAVYLSSLEDCVDFLKNVQGCVFFTTGSKNIRNFQEVSGANRFVYRVLPTSSSISECTKHHVAMKDIIAILGPLSEELNVAMFQAYRAKYVVMKDSGKAGGTPEKLKACRRLGIVPVIIGRPNENGISDLETLVKMLGFI